MDFRQEIEEIKNKFGDGLSKVPTEHTNNIIKKYGNWNKYPRKIKKMLKKEHWWELKIKVC